MVKEAPRKYAFDHHFTIQIITGMFLGIVVGLIIKWLPLTEATTAFIVDDVFGTGGQLFLHLLQLLVIPIIFCSLVCGSASLGDIKKIGRIGGKTILLYLFTTAFAITLAVLLASLFQVGHGLALSAPSHFEVKAPPSITALVVGLIPKNPFHALVHGNVLQVIFFSLLLGIAIAASGDAGEKVAKGFQVANEVLLKLIMMIMKTAPIGVFFLLGSLFAKVGAHAIGGLLGYFFCVLLVLLAHFCLVYTSFLVLFAKLNPLTFVKKMYTTMLFAFSISSSNASIPVVLRTVEFDLGVKNSIASFIIPLGATINMDGTAIMQGVATVFIAHAYNIDIGLVGYLTVILMATLASIGTAGVPSVGLITLAMVLQQVGLPVQGIALIIGIDRLLDMARTAVNVAGDAMVSCIVAKGEKALDVTAFNSKE
jgi:Na+/H+-dicarboxylate symporter